MLKNGYRDGYKERATNQKKWIERERVYVKGVVFFFFFEKHVKEVVKRNNKKNYWENWLFK